MAENRFLNVAHKLYHKGKGVGVGGPDQLFLTLCIFYEPAMTTTKLPLVG